MKPWKEFEIKVIDIVSKKYPGWVDLKNNKIYHYILKKSGLKSTDIISRKLKPDGAFFNKDTKELVIYEAKFQSTDGSADEKLQTCAFKIQQFRKLGNAFGATSIKYIYILHEWYKQFKYTDTLNYIKTVDGCDYIFEEELNAA